MEEGGGEVGRERDGFGESILFQGWRSGGRGWEGLPEGELFLGGGGEGPEGEFAGPGGPGGGGVGQGCFRQGALEVFEENTPGDAVNGEMVDGEAEAAGAVFAGIKEGGPEEGAGLIIEGGLQVGAVGLNVFQGGMDGEEIGTFPGSDGGDPAVVFLTETQAQGRVVVDDGLEGAAEGFRGGVVAEGEEE